jgi:hypothetical protein
VHVRLVVNSTPLADRCQIRRDYKQHVKVNAARQVVGFLRSRGPRCSSLDVGFVACSPFGRSGFLGVSPETIETYDLTSEEVACEMAKPALAQEAG